MMASSQASSDDSYSAIYLMPIFKVADKVFAKASLYSPTFTCSEDPHKSSFQICVEFNDIDIFVDVSPTSRDVSFQQLKIKFFDNNMIPRLVESFAPKVGDQSKWPRSEAMSKTFARPILDSEGELEELRLLVEISYSTAIPFAYPKRQESLRSMSLNMGCVFLDEKDPDFHILVEEGGEKGGERGEKLEEKGEEREKGGGGGGRGRPSDSGDPKIGTLVMGHTLIRSLVRWHRSLTHSLLSSLTLALAAGSSKR